LNYSPSPWERDLYRLFALISFLSSSTSLMSPYIPWQHLSPTSVAAQSTHLNELGSDHRLF
jgi:hypothetical protein